jgi:hypothetical protein
MTYLAIDTLQALPNKFQYIDEDTEEMPETITNQVDDCFASMSSDWQMGNYLNIVELANSQPIYCLCDIRVSVYYLYSLWASQNDITSEKVLTTLSNILSHAQAPWKASLVNQSDKSVNKVLSNSVTLLLRKIINHLDNPNTQERIWQENPADVLRALNGLHTQVNEQLNTPIELLENAFVSIKESYSLLEQQAQEINTHHQSVISVVKNSSNNAKEAKNVDTNTLQQIIKDDKRGDPELFNPSHGLKQLFKHITLLQDLINQDDPLKAAVVLHDIQHELDNFNPLYYFPEYFSSFASLRAKHAPDLEPLFEQQDSYQWRVLNECYKTNVDAFLALEAGQTGFDKDNKAASFEHYGEHDYHE